MHYFQTDFEFSKETKDLILKKYQNFFKEHFDHDAEYSVLRNITQITSIGKELSLYLKKFKVNTNFAGINAFVSNTSKKVLTNPHVDVRHLHSHLLPIKSRFNVLVLGNQEDPMMWWDHFKFGNPDHKEKRFRHNGLDYVSLAVPGDSIEERFQFLGKPTTIKSKLLTPSAFVDTYTAHALEISPIPRLIVSVPIDKHLEEFI